jgi:hypothetical protein
MVDQYDETDDSIETENPLPEKTSQNRKTIGDIEDREDFLQWWEERGQKGRKPRDKAGGRHQKNRDRQTDD